MNTGSQGVRNFLDASTAHVTRQDVDVLAHWATLEPEAWRPAPFRTIAHAYGYFIHVRLDGSAGGCGEAERLEYEQAAREDGISEAFFALQAYAREHGCWWINLDRDAEIIEALPVHEW
jgi:hypothetical protein